MRAPSPRAEKPRTLDRRAIVRQLIWLSAAGCVGHRRKRPVTLSHGAYLSLNKHGILGKAFFRFSTPTTCDLLSSCFAISELNCAGDV